MAAHEEYTLEQAAEDVGDLRGQVDRLNEILTLLDGPVPNVPTSSGCELFSVLGQPNYMNVAGLQMGLMGAQPATFPGTAVTAASLASLASFSIPANDADVGAVYELEVWGSGTQGSTAQTLQFAAVLGGTTMESVTLGTNFMAANSSFRWHVTVRAINHTTGSSGTWSSLIFGELSINGGNLLTSGASSANATNGFTSSEITTTYTKDTTAAQTLGLSAAWGSTTGAPTLTSRVAVPKRIC